MATVKRSRSITDFFKPSRSASFRRPSRSPSPLPPTSPDSTDTATDYAQAGRHSQYTGDSRTPSAINTTLPRSGTQELDDIYGAYGDSPTKTRFPPPQPERYDSTASTTTTTTRDQIDTMPTLGASTSSHLSSSQQHREPLRISTRSNTNSSNRPKQPRSKSNNELDLIDRLDISGLYGGGGFVRHEGPYAAATGSRSPGGHAPIDAFDPSAFSLANPSPRPGSQHPSSASSSRRPSSNGVSERARAARSAMDAMGGGDGPYGAARGSSKQVSMGFPGQQVDGKSAQLMEIYGFRDAEAWEDYGTARFDPASAAASRDSVVPAGASKEERMARTQSIWDIEATLKAGKPIGSAPPPVPVMPAEWSAAEVSPSNKPKRSKSLAARFRAGRRNPNNPMGGASDSDDGREAGQARSVPVTPVEDRRGARELPAAGGGTAPSSGFGTPASEAEVDRLGERTAAIRFEENGERAAGMTRSASGQDEEKKKGGGLKRLFSTKRK
ncbi:hypothetical protein JCM8547_007951 [Rhodosporidiobolus lusitaniae]